MKVEFELNCSPILPQPGGSVKQGSGKGEHLAMRELVLQQVKRGHGHSVELESRQGPPRELDAPDADPQVNAPGSIDG